MSIMLCIGHAFTFVYIHAITSSKPPVETPTVFLFGGSTKLNLAGSSTESKFTIPLPTSKCI